MSVRMIAVVLVVVMAFVGGMVWQRQATHVSSQQQEQQMGDPSGGMPGGMPEGTVAEPPADAHPGITWSVPKRWKDAGPRSMRVATYTIPVAGDDVEAGECAVFHFGATQGGGVDDNIARWVGQFENAGEPLRATKTIGKLKVHRVEVKGDYLAPSGPMMQSTGTKSGYVLLGAIVEGPHGGVFFKTTGPEKTIRAAAGEFDQMLETIKPE